jgi:amino acid transporter
LGFLNSMNMKIVSKVQISFTITKIAALSIIVLVGIWTFANSSKSIQRTLTEWFVSDKPYNFDRIAMALYTGLFGYSGW